MNTVKHYTITINGVAYVVYAKDEKEARKMAQKLRDAYQSASNADSKGRWLGNSQSWGKQCLIRHLGIAHGSIAQKLTSSLDKGTLRLRNAPP